MFTAEGQRTCHGKDMVVSSSSSCGNKAVGLQQKNAQDSEQTTHIS
jgi:hypothetical protein